MMVMGKRGFNPLSAAAALLVLWASAFSLPAVAKQSQVGSAVASVTPANPKPGGTFSVKVTGSGTNGSWCSLKVNVSIPGLGLSQNKGGTVQHGSAHGLQVDTFVFNIPATASGGEDLTPSISISGCGGGAVPLASGSSSPSVSNVPKPAFNIIKTPLGVGSYLFKGQVFQYSITVTNNGAGDATNTTMTDDVDLAHLDYLSSDASSAVDGAGVKRLTWNLGLLKVGQTRTGTIKVRVKSGTPTGTQINNAATVTSGSVTATNSARVQTVDNRPRLAIRKGIDVVTEGYKLKSAGDGITYVIEISNLGHETASNVVVEDALLALQNVTLSGLVDRSKMSVSPTAGNTDSLDARWELATLDPGQTVKLFAKGTLRSSLPDDPNSPFVLNRASVTSSNAAVPTVSTPQDTVVEIRQEPKLLVTKTALTPTVQPGDMARFRITVENEGTADATDVVVQDIINGTDLTVPVNVVSGSISYNSLAGSLDGFLQANIPTLAVGQSPQSFVFEAKVPDGTTVGSTVTNTVLVEAANQPSTLVTPITKTATVNVLGTPKLSLTKTPDLSEVGFDELAVFTITYTNSGNQKTQGGILLSDLIDPTLEIVDVDPPATSTTVGVPGLPTHTLLEWDNLGDLNPLQSGKVEVTVRPAASLSTADKGLELGNVASLETTFNGAKVEAPPKSAKVRFEPRPRPIILKIPSVPVTEPLQPGRRITYTLRVAPSGTDPISNVVVVDELPADLELESASLTPVENQLPDGSTELEFLIPELKQKTDIVVTAKVRSGVVSGSKITNVASASVPGMLVPNQAPFISHRVYDAAFSIEKSVVGGRQYFQRGDVFKYQLKYTNTGAVKNSDVKIEDLISPFLEVLPGANPRFTQVSVDPGNSDSAQRLTWDVNAVSPRKGGVVTVEVRVKSTAPENVAISNSAEIYSKQTGFIDSNKVDIYVEPIELRITKDVSSSVVNDGDPVSYTIEYQNTGFIDAPNTVITDRLPDGFDLKATPPGATYDAGTRTLTWDLNTLNAKTPAATLRIDGIARNAKAKDRTLKNTAVITSTDGGVVQARASDRAELTVKPGPIFSVRKTVEGQTQVTAAPGDRIHYQIVVSKKGGAATAVSVTDKLPQELENISSNRAYTVGRNGELVFALKPFKAGTRGPVVIDIEGDIKNPLNPVSFDNLATLTAAELGGGSVSSNVVSVTVDSVADLRLTKKGSVTDVNSPASGTGDSVIYTLDYANVGTADAADVTIVDTLPSQLTDIRSTDSNVTINGNTVKWDIGTVLAGGGSTVSVSARVKTGLADGLVIPNSGSISGKQPAPAVGKLNNTSNEWQLTVGVAQLKLTKTPDKTVVNPGEDITWTLSYSNPGTADTGVIKLTESLPTALTYKANSAVLPAGATLTEASGNVLVFDNLPSLAPQGVSQISFVTTVAAVVSQQDATLQNVVTGSATKVPSTTSTPLTSPPLVSTQPELKITKVADVKKTHPGDLVRFTITVENIGSDVATGVVLEDTLAKLLSLKKFTGQPTVNGQKVQWALGDIPAKQQRRVKLTARVISPLADGKTVFNTATVTSVEEPNGKSDTVKLPVRNASLAITKTPSTSQVKAGDAGQNNGGSFSYLITVSNTGSAIATGVLFQDDVPAELEILSVKAGKQSCQIVAQLVACNVPDLPSGDSFDIHLKVKARESLRDGLPIHNQASVSSPSTGKVTTPPDTPKVLIKSAPRLTVTKQALAGSVVPGDPLRWELLIENTGSDIASNYTISDPLPQYTSFVSASDNGSHGAGVVTWGAAPNTLPDLPPGASHTVTLDVLLAASIPNQTVLANTATLILPHGGTTTTTTSQPPSGVTPPVVSSAAKLRVEKTLLGASGKPVSPGQQLTYNLKVENTGNAPATGVALFDVIPDEVTYLSASSGVDTSQLPRISWSLGTVNPGKPLSATVTMTVKSPLANGTKVLNLAEVAMGGMIVDSDSDSRRVISSPKLSITKTPAKQEGRAGDVIGGAGQQNGESVTFTITYDNTGNETATNVEISDFLDPRLKFVSASKPYVWDAGTRTVTWQIGALAPGVCVAGQCSLSLHAQIKDGVVNGEQIENFAHISADQGAKTSKRAVVKVHSEGRLNVTKTVVGSTLVKAGKRVKYLIEYENIGSDTLTDLILSDHLPSGVGFDSASDGGLYANGNVVWFEGAGKSLAAGVGGSVHLSVLAPAVVASGSNLPNAVTVTGRTATGKVGATDTADITVSSSPRLTFDKSGPRKKAVAAGELITYELKVSNDGSDSASDIFIEDVLPTGVEFVSATEGGATAASNSRLVRWSLAGKTLPPGQSLQVSVTGRVASPIANNTRLENKGTATHATTTGVVTSNTTGHVVTSNPFLEIEKSIVGASGRVKLNAGDPVTYLIEYRNTGSDVATGVTLEDHLPTGLRLVATESINGNAATVAGGVIDWAIGNLAAGQSGSVHVYAQVDTVVGNGSTLDNFAQIDSAETVPVTDHAPIISVSSAPDIVLSKSTQVALAEPDLAFSYEIDWFNRGSEWATNTQIVDCLPPQVIFASASHGGALSGSCGTDRQEVTWNLGDVGAKTGGAVFVNVTVKGPTVVDNADLLVNAASVTADNMTARSATHTLVVSSSPALALVEKTSSPVVSAGDSVLYTLTFANFGNAVARDVQLTDELPPDAIPLLVSDGGKFDLLAGKVVWDVGSLPPGGSVTVTYSLGTAVGTPDGTVWQSTASITASNAWPTTAQSQVYIGSTPNFDLSKSGPSAANAGEEVSWRIDYFNSGNGTAADVRLQDVIPSGWTYVRSTATSSVSSGVIAWDLGSVAPLSGAAVEVTLAAPNTANDGVSYLNTVSLQASNSPLTWTAASPVVLHSHTDLAVTIDAQRTPVEANTNETFDVTWANTGNQDAPNATVTATLPANTQFVSATGNYSVVNGQVVWTLTEPLSGGGVGLIAGSTGAETMVVKVADGTANGTMLKSQAEITADTGQPAIDVAKFEVVSSPILVLAKSSSEQEVEVGDIVTFTITVSNQGNEDATSVVISDSLPAGLQLLDSSTPGAVVDTASNTVSLSVGVVSEPSGSASLMFRAKVTPAASDQIVTNTATITSGEIPDANTSSNLRTAPLKVTPVPVMGGDVLLLMLGLIVLLAAHYRRRRF